MSKSYKVEGMTCDGCARAVTRAIQRIDPALGVQVDLARGRVTVDGPADDARIAEAVAAAGFTFAGPASA